MNPTRQTDLITWWCLSDVCSDRHLNDTASSTAMTVPPIGSEFWHIIDFTGRPSDPYSRSGSHRRPVQLPAWKNGWCGVVVPIYGPMRCIDGPRRQQCASQQQPVLIGVYRCLHTPIGYKLPILVAQQHYSTGLPVLYTLWPCPVSERLAKQKFSTWGFPINPNKAEIFFA